MSIKIEKTKKISAILKNLSNENKLLILCFISKDKKNVTEILSSVNISQSQVSQYLGKMKLEGILESKKIGKEVFYSIKNTKILEIISNLKNIFN